MTESLKTSMKTSMKRARRVVVLLVVLLALAPAASVFAQQPEAAAPEAQAETGGGEANLVLPDLEHRSMSAATAAACC